MGWCSAKQLGISHRARVWFRASKFGMWKSRVQVKLRQRMQSMIFFLAFLFQIEVKFGWLHLRYLLTFANRPSSSFFKLQMKPLSRKHFYQWKLGPCEAKRRPEVCRAGISLNQGGKRIGKHRNCDDVSVLTIDIQHLRQLTLLSCPFMLQLGFTAVAMPLASKSDLIVDVNQRHSYWYRKIGYSISHGSSFNQSSFQSTQPSTSRFERTEYRFCLCMVSFCH